MRGVVTRELRERVPRSLGAPLIAAALLLAGLVLTYSRQIFEGLVVAGYDSQLDKLALVQDGNGTH